MLETVGAVYIYIYIVSILKNKRIKNKRIKNKRWKSYVF